MTLQYVDDSTNMISCKDLGILQLYINDFFLLIESFYNANKLALNASKSKLLVTCKNKYRTMANKIILQASGYIIEQSKKIKILGIYYTSGLENQPNINNIISKVNSRIVSLRQIFKYSTIRTKKILTSSIIISVFRYAAPILIDSNKAQVSKLQSLLLKCSRNILGFQSWKMSTIQIFKELNWLTIQQLFMRESLKFIHKIIYNDLPKSIMELISFSLTRSDVVRLSRKPFLIKKSKSQFQSQSVLYRAVFLYNNISDTIRYLNPKMFSKSINDYIKQNYPPFEIPKTDHG